MTSVLQLELLLTVEVEVDAPVSAGVTPLGEVRMLTFTRGSFAGEGLRGALLAGGTDWQTVRSDGAVEIRAHYLLQTDQDERIEVQSRGLRHAPAGVLERIARGEPVDASEYYFRTAIRFNTGAPRLQHLTRLLAVGVGERSRTAVKLSVFRVP